MDDPSKEKTDGLVQMLRRQLLTVLPRLLGPLSDELLAALTQRATSHHLRRGETLFRQGDPGDAWYVVISGRLAVRSAPAEGQPERRLAEVGCGDGVGEMSLLTGQPRSASVLAMRDTQLARLSVADFEDLMNGWPLLARALLRMLSQRLQSRTGGSALPGPGLTLALLPVSPHVAVHPLASRLKTCLGRFGSVRLVDLPSARAADLAIDRALDTVGEHGDGPGRIPADHPSWLRLRTWLDEQAADHDFLVLAGAPGIAGWNALLSGAADHLLLLADGHAQPPHRTQEDLRLADPAPGEEARRTLVLLHGEHVLQPQGTMRWLQSVAADEHLHIRQHLGTDIERLARAVAGRSVGLVMSGGGARCFSQLGVALAMRELGIPIDHLAGTSAGAMSAYLIADERSSGQMDQAVERFHRARPNSGFTLPLFSLLHGRRLQRALREACGDQRIEDLWLPLTIVASNLTSSSVERQRQGPVRDALLASATLPGLSPPMVRGGQLLVDGGLMNNLPVSIARERFAGRIVAVDVCQDLGLAFAGDAYPSPWAELTARVMGRRSHQAPPGLTEVLLHSLLMSSFVQTRQMRLEADLCLRPELAGFGMFDLAPHREIVAAGYRHGMQHLPAFAQQT